MQVSSGGCCRRSLKSSRRAHWCRTHRQSCLLVVNATCTRHSRARVGFLGLLRLLLQLLALDHPQLLGPQLLRPGQEDVWQLTCFARRPAGCWEMDCQQGGRAAPKGAGLLQLDGREAAQPLQRKWEMCASVRRCGGAPLHAAAPGTIFTRHRLSPATCFVPGVPPRNKHLHATGQTALLDLTPGNRALWVAVAGRTWDSSKGSTTGIIVT